MGDSVVWSIECDVWPLPYYGSLDRVPERGDQLSTDEKRIERRTFISLILHAAALRSWKTYKAHRPSADWNFVTLCLGPWDCCHSASSP
jgi:hypothetical protein